MRVIIMGCGRVGSTLAAQLDMERHDITVIDRDPDRRRLLPGSFSGRFLAGNGYGRRLLLEAGIDSADAFVAAASDDSTNMVGARIAKEDYRVPHAIAHIHDAGRADVYRELGIPTVSSAGWAAGRIHQMLVHRNLAPDRVFGNGETLLVHETLPEWFGNRPLRTLDVDGEIRVVAVTRGGHSFLPERDTPAEPGDEVSFAVAASCLDRLRSFLGKELGV